MNKEKIKEKIKALQDQLAQIEAKEQKEKNKVDFIIIDGWAYETKEHDLNKKLADIKIPEGKELWLPHECWKFYEDKELREKLNLSDCWFFVQQVRENTSEVARFVTDSGGACLDCGWDATYANSSLGVRFKWKVKK